MGKISIGLRGWRFDEEDVFTEAGEFRPLDEVPEDTAERLVRLEDIVGSPCDGCWLIHGDENLDDCNAAEVVYGEPQAEVVLCADHENDLVYWFREADGAEYAGTDEFSDAFHEWFLDGGRAPEAFDGVEHVDTDPDELPEPPAFDQDDVDGEWRVTDRIDMRDVDLSQDYPTSE